MQFCESDVALHKRWSKRLQLANFEACCELTISFSKISAEMRQTDNFEIITSSGINVDVVILTADDTNAPRCCWASMFESKKWSKSKEGVRIWFSPTTKSSVPTVKYTGVCAEKRPTRYKSMFGAVRKGRKVMDIRLSWIADYLWKTLGYW